MANNSIVLIVEDNPKILDLNRRILEKEGCLVVTAVTLKEARERLEVTVPDIAVLDIMLPDGCGLDFLTELREKCDAPVLFLTAKTGRENILAGLAAGGNDYITKPYNIDEFRLRVIGILRLVSSIRPRKTPISLLTERELPVARLAASGLSNKDIAARVYLSESRVKTSLSGIYRKFGIVDKKDKRCMLAKILEIETTQTQH
ncbi:MAG: response regulator [Chitinispirillales bacterium]|jgi:DNA-binding response OmpR family regulator|nr:response regulator [Chitinispirillales bacterium]